MLERIARGLRLTTPEREHLFILAFGHPPQTRLTVTDDMTPRLQRVLDAFTIPAIIRTASWDVIARNAPAAGADRLQPTAAGGAQRAAPPVYPGRRPRCTLEDWQRVGQLIVNAFRADVTRMGATKETDQLIAELSQQSVEFARFWQSHDVAGHGEGYKRINHPQMGPLDSNLPPLPWRAVPIFPCWSLIRQRRRASGKFTVYFRGSGGGELRGKFVQHQRIALQRVDPQPIAIEPRLHPR